MKSGKKKSWLPKVLIALVVLVILAIGAMAAVWKLNVYTLNVTLLGDEEITVEVGASFEDPGAAATFSGTLLMKDELQVPIETRGKVDTSAVGTYELTYYAHITYQDLLWEQTDSGEVKRIVHVVDTQMPQITLTYTEGYYTLPGHEYVEEGFSASDSYDGDLTDQVIRTVSEGTVVYTVTDSSGNVTTVTREIVYDDPIPPEIALTGDQTITITEGDAFTDPGCQASDNCDGDLTASIVVTGTVDANKPGTYTLTYSVSDAWGNSASVSRTVVVEEKPEVPTTEPLPVIPSETLPPNGKVIYLTFDDGPGPHTARLLDILAKYDVKATFFIVGTDYLYLLPRMAAEGHTIAMHTYSHKYSKIYSSDDAFFEDLYKIQAEILNYTGQTSTILRFPGGSSNTVSRNYSKGIMTRLTQAVKDMGYRYFDWNVDSNDAGGARSSDDVFRNVVKGIGNKKYSIVLQHDVKGFSVDAVDRIIRWGLAYGYTFEALTPSSPACEHGVGN